MNAAAAVAGSLVAVGVLLLVAGVVTPPAEPSNAKKRRGGAFVQRVADVARRNGPRLAIGLVGGVALAVITGLPLMILVGPIAAVGLPTLLGQPPNREIALLEALDRWVRTLAALLPAGRSIADAIRISARQAPPLLSRPLQVLVARMEERWSTRQALFAMADDLDSADGDAVFAALALAADRGGTGATATLNALADTIQDRLRAMREIETERAKPRVVVRQVTIITSTVLTAGLVFGRSFFEPYGSPLGQAILAALIAVYVGSLIALRRLTLPRRRDRILGGVS